MRVSIVGLAATLLTVSLTTGDLFAETIKLSDGTRLSGQATGYDAEAKVLTFETDAGEVRRLPLDQLNARSVYQVHRSLVAKDDGPAQLVLGNFARDAELFAHSARHYDQAAAADPGLQADVDAQVALMHERAAQFCMDKAKDAVAKSDIREAEKWLKRG